MKYFLLAFLLVCVLVGILAGPRGRHSPSRPLEFFPDMVRQPKVKPQSPSGFFADGIGPRRPVDGTTPMGYDIPRKTAFSQLAAGAPLAGQQPPPPPTPDLVELIPTPDRDFTFGPDYYNTGMMGDHWGTGLPIKVTKDVLARGQQRFNINCSVCHGQTGGGNGVTSKYGLNGIANYHDEKYVKIDDGNIFYTITNGHNSMMGYGANIAVSDRWAIVAYIRTLQKAQTVKLEELPPEQAQAVQAAAAAKP